MTPNDLSEHLSEKKKTHLTAVLAAALEGKRPSNMSRMKYASFVSGISSGHLSERFAKSSSDMTDAAWSFILFVGV